MNDNWVLIGWHSSIVGKQMFWQIYSCMFPFFSLLLKIYICILYVLHRKLTYISWQLLEPVSLNKITYNWFGSKHVPFHGAALVGPYKHRPVPADIYKCKPAMDCFYTNPICECSLNKTNTWYVSHDINNVLNFLLFEQLSSHGGTRYGNFYVNIQTFLAM